MSSYIGNRLYYDLRKCIWLVNLNSSAHAEVDIDSPT